MYVNLFDGVYALHQHFNRNQICQNSQLKEAVEFIPFKVTIYSLCKKIKKLFCFFFLFH